MDDDINGISNITDGNGSTLIYIFLGLSLLASLYLLMGRSRGNRGPVASGDVTPSMRRGNFSKNTRNDAQQQYVTHQFNQLENRPPSAVELQQGQQELQQGVLGQREFHVRHVEADSFLRSATMMVIRAPNADLISALQAVFDAFGGGTISGTLRAITPTISDPGYNGSQWFSSLGRRRVAELRDGITNCLGNLFFSEGQGNLRAGTRTDVTEEAIALLGRDRIAEIANSAIALREKLGLQPRVELVQNHVFSSYDGASGEYTQYGYNQNRDQDNPVNVLNLVSRSNALVLARNTDLVTGIRLAFLHYPVRTLSVITLILALLYNRYS